ncbi:arylsulfotransferase family protein [Salinirubellus salinus]|uniref:Arylsulfotransferase family protein n=1 Tax=Salinirubellus salinus TaxID=1364945 RepID=A0A9E7UAL5_9EURY|nr:arylsulfotransferase family protein [Salinirubellus salinus]UWM54378.1 arylsulfotransferase family protein [Salinirubellus salinus]
MDRRTVVRVGFVLVLAVLAIPIGSAYGSLGTTSDGGDPVAERTAPPRDDVTVVTADAFGSGRIAAYAPNGSVLYYNDTYKYYHDVDPDPPGERTVMYVGSYELNASACHSELSCVRSVVERLNLTTGDVTRLYSRTSTASGGAIHDVDRVGESRLLVAEIAQPDRVYIVNTTTGIVEWAWPVRSAYDHDSGGRFPSDWTHLNDVEYLADGRVMVSLRNQDQVVFVDLETGLDREWTLGEDDDHATLYEQHNPDYIPAEQGGPAVLIGDSENGRVVEYQREGDSWRRSWVWRDAQMQWPRDADRLPNGHTLIADTNGDRVLEVDRSGQIVWSHPFPGPYDVERLGTGDESAGGRSAAALGLESRSTDGGVRGKGDGGGTIGPAARLVVFIKDLLPSPVVNGLLFWLPDWMSAPALFALVGQLGVVAVWAATEVRWSQYVVRVRSPLAVTTSDETAADAERAGDPTVSAPDRKD